MPGRSWTRSATATTTSTTTASGPHTPAEVHYGLAAAKAADRADVLNTARNAHPERFSTPTAVPKILTLPDAAWINKPANHDDQQAYQTAA